MVVPLIAAATSAVLAYYIYFRVRDEDKATDVPLQFSLEAYSADVFFSGPSGMPWPSGGTCSRERHDRRRHHFARPGHLRKSRVMQR